MRGHIIRNNNKFLQYFQTNQISLISIDKYLTFIYKDNNTTNKLLNNLLDNKININIFKQEKDIIIKVLNNNLDFDNFNDDPLDSNILLLLKLIEISNIEVSIQKINNQYKIKIYTEDYKHILNNYCQKEYNNYVLNINMLDTIYKEIEKYNSLVSVSNLKIDNYIEENNLFTIKKKYYTNKTTTLIIINNKERNLIFKGIQNILFEFKNNELFDKLILPEILDLYIENNSNITSEKLEEQLNQAFYQANNNLYILNFSKEIIEANIKYLHKLNDKKNYKLEVNKNYIKEVPKVEESKVSYSYGYINILLIAFIISLLTIIICLTKY